eukprot:scaffold241422_cov32-Tisochrysis_lutea.AAC.2
MARVARGSSGQHFGCSSSTTTWGQQRSRRMPAQEGWHGLGRAPRQGTGRRPVPRGGGAEANDEVAPITGGSSSGCRCATLADASSTGVRHSDALPDVVITLSIVSGKAANSARMTVTARGSRAVRWSGTRATAIGAAAAAAARMYTVV